MRKSKSFFIPTCQYGAGFPTPERFEVGCYVLSSGVSAWRLVNEAWEYGGVRVVRRKFSRPKKK